MRAVTKLIDLFPKSSIVCYAGTNVITNNIKSLFIV